MLDKIQDQKFYTTNSLNAACLVQEEKWMHKPLAAHMTTNLESQKSQHTKNYGQLRRNKQKLLQATQIHGH